MGSRDPAHLHPALRRRWEIVQSIYWSAQQAAAARGVDMPDLKLGEVWRSSAQQKALYAQGRTAPGRIVTKAKPGQSLHERVDSRGAPCSRALDFFFAGMDPFDDDHPWEVVGGLGIACGLKWGGRWEDPDRPHLELASGEPQP